MPLKRFHFQQTNRMVMDLALNPAQFEMSPPYQRASVWTLDQRRALIRSLLEGVPVGVVYVNYRSEMDPRVYVVDGKQRLETILGFLDDGFYVPARWFADEETEASARPSLLDRDQLDGDVLFSQLTPGGQGRLRRCSVALYETQMPTEDDERDLYLRVNTGGTAHTAQELLV